MGWGSAMGVAYCLIAFFLRVVGGLRGIDELGISLGKLLVLYLISGSLAGLLVGLMRKRTNTKLGSAFVGFLVAVPVGGLITFSTLPRSQPLWMTITTWLIFAGTFGPGAGVALWNQLGPGSRSSDGRDPED